MQNGGNCQNRDYYDGDAHLALLVSILSVPGSMAANKITRANSRITGVTLNHRNFCPARKCSQF